MTAYRGEIWLANLNPVKKNNEVGKVRPVLILQNDDLNESSYPTTVILPLTTSLVEDAQPLRMRIGKRENLKEDSDILIAQIRAIDNERLIEKLCVLSAKELKIVKQLLDEVLT
ncbi:MAG: PemK family transcriptional regulator [Sulfurimonas sp. RIFOXYD12_FULL_33_39]|uniref:type II toxin-antitoxin system PemK/MazF family toxin n=1 Tax=unclassified Sulfurimonas TaxID=2623549 RepID=UPI0008C19AF3|nr:MULTISPECIES: type II toxin-antitoxin system PemK/MazF family toxin [unclassified Sulfurimonas]OHE10906.1 MAG: PemK family transcriptional regulator [Sulfurimonas sp. RIFOXYD12_FULL_33_39]OHE13324.1 MAG: PemK family transcriptional regulator [Sulfurimonas sp. RIFOXYD2_FULL_34_21]